MTLRAYMGISNNQLVIRAVPPGYDVNTAPAAVRVLDLGEAVPQIVMRGQVFSTPASVPFSFSRAPVVYLAPFNTWTTGFQTTKPFPVWDWEAYGSWVNVGTTGMTIGGGGGLAIAYVVYREAKSA